MINLMVSGANFSTFVIVSKESVLSVLRESAFGFLRAFSISRFVAHIHSSHRLAKIVIATTFFKKLRAVV